MRRPKVGLENYSEVYDYYAVRKPRRGMGRAVHAAFGAIYHPRVMYDGAAKERIHHHLQANRQVLLCANHTSADDPFVLAALAHREDVLRPLRGTTFIPGKAPIFGIRLFRPVLDNFVALPAFRTKDVAQSQLPREQATELRKAAGKRLTDICVDKANAGYNIAIFPQGTRESINAGRAASVRSGIGQIACGLARPQDFRILPLGICYQRNRRTNLNPVVYIGDLIALPATPSEVTERVADALLYCVKHAGMALQ